MNKGNVLFFSSFNFAYLDRACVLANSVRKFHPKSHIVALITDLPSPSLQGNWAGGLFDEVVYAKELDIPCFDAWMFKHDVVEACTAVKGPFLLRAVRDYEFVIYLDPDICLFSDLSPIINLLEENNIVVTPHQLTPDSLRTAIIDNEICSLKTGVYNLGFLAVRSTREGCRFAEWWNDRLLDFCYDDMANGLFVDQRWCDHVPGFFDGVHVLRDPGYNVASWNLSQRKISIDARGIFVNKNWPLRFWHFTKLGSLADTMTKRYAKDNFPVYEIWNWYRSQVLGNRDDNLREVPWAYNVYADGSPIEKKQRLLYRNRQDLQAAFPNPFLAGPGTYKVWYADNEVKLS